LRDFGGYAIALSTLQIYNIMLTPTFIENFHHAFIVHNNSMHKQLSNNSATDQTICKHELEKAYLIIEQKEKEIAYLKEIIELMKK
jgi:hypothetical protein